ncbi:unnamed protein product [Adineta ricciae]|uniref:Envelope fusion glycoprotein n=1 Tax=Adineta ricciae TaxID=249248 RepID=A0A815M3X0_ADIRI|nr:unnamed protein product [Adineta ricciae]CAF1598876.1 unnamed protein product [Adineta ricciae]
MNNFFTAISSVILIYTIPIARINASPNSIIVDVDKGIVLQHVGVYSEKFEESIFHIFVPYNDLCNESPDSPACRYVHSTQPDIIDLGTIVSDAYQLLNYDKNNISAFIETDVRRIFSHHEIHKFIGKSRSTVFFIDDRFYMPGNTVESSIVKPSSSSDIEQHALIYQPTNPTTRILDNIRKEKIGYDFLNNKQMDDLLSVILPTMDSQLDDQNLKENLNTLVSMVVGQSIYVLKSCSTDHKSNLPNSPSCLVISTMFRRLPKDSSLHYQVYRMMPLPILFKDEAYIYSDLPDTIAFDYMQKNIITWDDTDSKASTCIFSKIVQCRNYPLVVPISTLPCLSELFTFEPSSSNSNCAVAKSKVHDGGILNIQDNIWYFYIVKQASYCTYQSLNTPTNIRITEPLIISLPCNKPAHCIDSHILPASCTNASILLKSTRNRTMTTPITNVVRFNNIVERLVTAYQTTAKSTLLQIQSEIDESEPLFEKIFEGFASPTLSFIASILTTVVLVILRKYRRNNNQDVQELKTEINRIKRDLIQDV